MAAIGGDRLPRWGAISGLLMCGCWAPMVLVIPRLPDLGSVAEVERFWRQHTGLMQAVIASVSVGFLFLLAFLAAFTAWLRRVHEGLAFMALGSAVMFMTALNVAVGLDAAGGLMLAAGTGSGAMTYLLHTAAFVLAAPAAFTGAGFFVAVAAAGFISDALPRGAVWLAVVGVVANIGALGGVFAATGPLNSGNGVLGGIAAPLGLYVLWVFTVSVWSLAAPTGPAARRERSIEFSTEGVQ